MYQKFYHLHRAPFQLTVDPDFFWAGAKYENGLQAMRYGLEHRGGLTLLTGDAGIGKTAVVHALFRRLEDQRVLTAMIPDPCLTEEEFFNLVLAALGIAERVQGRDEFHDHLLALLERAGGLGRQVLLVIDEAQRLADSVIREIDAMLELGPGPAGGLSVCLVGRINDPRALMELVGGAFTDRVTVTCHLSPLTAEESACYIRHRLQVAGAESEIFTEDALREVHRFAEGYPGLINGLCDFALFSAYNREMAQVTADVVRSSGASLRLAEDGAYGAAGRGAEAGSGPDRSLAPVGEDGGRECAAAEPGQVPAGRDEDGSPGQDAVGPGSDQPPVRRGRVAVISSFAVAAVLVLLVGGILYYREPHGSGRTPPVEAPAASRSGAPLEQRPRKMDAAPAAPRATTTADGRQSRQAGDTATVPVAEPAATREDTAAANPAEPGGDHKVAGQEAAQPGPGSGTVRPHAVAAPEAGAARQAGQQAETVAAAPGGDEKAAGPAQQAAQPVPDRAAGTRDVAHPLPPALKALLAGGSLAGEPSVKRLPDLRITPVPGHVPAAEHDRGATGHDPADVIDWVLKKKHHRDPGR